MYVYAELVWSGIAIYVGVRCYPIPRGSTVVGTNEPLSPPPTHH